MIINETYYIFIYLLDESSYRNILEKYIGTATSIGVVQTNRIEHIRGKAGTSSSAGG